MRYALFLLYLACSLVYAAPIQAPKLVSTVCLACHGIDGNSVMTTDPNLAGQHADYLFKQLREFQSGKRNNAVMSGLVQGLSVADLRALALYFSQQKPLPAQAKTNGKGSLGERIYRAGIASKQVPACAACHGAQGNGLPAQFPRLAGQHADYTLAQLLALRNGTRANAPMMSLISSRLSEAEMSAVADYMQGLH